MTSSRLPLSKLNTKHLTKSKIFPLKESTFTDCFWKDAESLKTVLKILNPKKCSPTFPLYLSTQNLKESPRMLIKETLLINALSISIREELINILSPKSTSNVKDLEKINGS